MSVTISAPLILDHLITETQKGFEYTTIVTKYIEAEETKNKIKFADEDKRMLVLAFKEATLSYPNFETIQTFHNNIIIEHIENVANTFMFNPETRTINPIDKQAVLNWFEPKAAKRLMAKKSHTAHLGYDPTTSNMWYKKDDNIKTLNLYVPPTWLKPYFYGTDKPETVTNMPEVYNTFLNYLTDGDEQSIKFITHWLACLVQPTQKPFTYLCAIGHQGIGKGLLGAIMRELVGESNYTETTMRKAESTQFNKMFKNKRITFLDELDVSAAKTENFLKPFINETIEIQEKGVDQEIYKNYSGFYLASNYIASLRIEESDRRYSLIETNGRMSHKIFCQEVLKAEEQDIVKAYFEPSNIKQLGLHLLGIKVDRRLIDTPLAGKKKTKVKEAAQLDWEQSVIDIMAVDKAGQFLTFDEANAWLADNANKKAPSRHIWQELSEGTAKPYFKCIMKRSGEKRLRGIEFYKLDEQPERKIENE
jgi:hypothetical protein